METEGAKTGIKTKINLMFLVGKFMNSFNYKFDEVLKLNWFTFNDLLDSLRGVRLERETQELSLFLSEIVIEKSKDKQDVYQSIIEEKKDAFKKYTEYDTSERDIEEMEAALLGRKRGN